MKQPPDRPHDGESAGPEPDGHDGDAAVTNPLPAIDTVASGLHAHFARLLELTIEAQRWGGVPADAGLTVRDYLELEAGLPGWLAGQVVAVADRIEVVPAVAAAFRAGVLSFDQLAAFVRETSGYNGRLLARLDEEAASLADQLASQGRSGGWVGQVQFLIEDLQAPGWAQRQEKRAARGNRTTIAQDFDGGGYVHHDLDAVSLATYVNGLADKATELGDTDAPRGRQLADAAVALAEDQLAGHTTRTTHGDGGGGTVRTKPARPTLVAHLDIEHATVDRFGQLLRITGAADRLPALSAELVEMLATNADLLLQIRQGARPLLELAATDTDDIPEQIRRTVVRRDRGCRWTGCTAPLRLIHAHHIIRRTDGGSDDPDNLICLCSFHHLRYVHRLGWHPDLDPVSGRVTWTRPGSTTHASMPHGHRPTPRRDPTLLADWLTPPRSPPPDHLEPAEEIPPDRWHPPPDAWPAPPAWPHRN